jgi:hypothetical protein
MKRFTSEQQEINDSQGSSLSNPARPDYSFPTTIDN